jgi:molybdopterin-guanine dinucleotide biosynthesis protein B
VHVVGRRNAGKTTLVCELVRELSERRMRVATIKHTHHNHELDTPGKDSWKHREAGAVGVGILSPHLMAAFVTSDRRQAPNNGYEQLSGMFQDCDLILVEGDLHAQGLKLEVWRSEVSQPPYAQTDDSIHAVISDEPTDVQRNVWPRSDVPGLVDRILQLIDVRGTLPGPDSAV